MLILATILSCSSIGAIGTYNERRSMFLNPTVFCAVPSAKFIAQTFNVIAHQNKLDKYSLLMVGFIKPICR